MQSAGRMQVNTRTRTLELTLQLTSWYSNALPLRQRSRPLRLRACFTTVRLSE